MQQTLTGETIETTERDRPSTFVYCPECDEWLLRGDRHTHPHETVDAPGDSDDGDDTDADGSGGADEPEVVGRYYDVELSFTTSYYLRVPAYSTRDAKKVAEALTWHETPHDYELVWADTRELSDITADADEDVIERLETQERAP